MAENINTAISIKVVPEQSGKVEYERERLLGIATRKYMHAETLALLTKPLYFPNMKYLEQCHGNTIIF
jgi:hypothetical protein